MAGSYKRIKDTVVECVDMTLIGAVSVAETSRFWNRTAELVSDTIGLARNHVPASIPVPAIEQKSRDLVHQAAGWAQRVSDRAEDRLRRAESKRKWVGQEQREVKALRREDRHLVDSSDDDWGDEWWPDRRKDVEPLDERVDEDVQEQADAEGERDALSELRDVLSDLDKEVWFACLKDRRDIVLPKSGLVLVRGGNGGYRMKRSMGKERVEVGRRGMGLGFQDRLPEVKMYLDW